MTYTHTAYEYGVDARVRSGYKRKVTLRETKTMWISQDGRRYSKKAGGRVFGDWPLFMIDLESIEEKPE